LSPILSDQIRVITNIQYYSWDLIAHDVKRKEFVVNNFFETLPKVFNIYQRSVEEIISFAEAKKIKHLGLTPWMDGDYQPVVDFIQNYRFQYLEKITFYHLRKRDYKVLYNLIN